MPVPAVSHAALVTAAYATYEAWLEAGQQLATSESANRWALGDWARTRDPRWGDLAAAADTIGVSRTTLYHRVTVAHRFPPDRRRADLSYSHHAEVVALPAEVADRLLAAAAGEGWTVARLRAAAHEASVEGENARLRTRVRDLEAALARPATARAYRQDATRAERMCRDGWRQAERGLDEAMAAIAAQVAHPGRAAAHGNARRALADRLGEVFLVPGDHLQLTPAARAKVEGLLAEIRRTRHAASETTRAAAVQAEIDQVSVTRPTPTSTPVETGKRSCAVMTVAARAKVGTAS